MAKNLTIKAKKGAIGALNKDVIKKIKADTGLVAKIITASGKSYPTVMRWLDENSEFLTMANCLTVICEELKLTPEKVLNKKAA